MSKFLNITVCTLDTVVDVGGAFSTENSPVTMVIGFSHNVQHAQKKMLQWYLKLFLVWRTNRFYGQWNIGFRGLFIWGIWDIATIKRAFIHIFKGNV